jgi:glycosyltransferase involved in cell wall biosynthesis
MARQAAVVSFRLGGDDGVSVEARKWATALHDLGFEVRRVAGVIEDGGAPDDAIVAELALDAPEPPAAATVREALDGADLVVVENLCSLPLHVEAARIVRDVLEARGGRVLFRHHDLPWQRRHLAHLEREFPPRLEHALHTTVNLRSRRELEARGYEHAHTVHNRFDLDPPAGDRSATRAAFGLRDDELVVFHPARAIERKNVPGGVRFATALDRLAGGRTVRYWLSGPAEDGYGPMLEKILHRATVPVVTGRARSAADAYAACDVVVLPSTWEGFGNPAIESIAHRRPCAAFPYPVLSEILATGVRLFSTESPENLAKFLAEPDEVREQAYEVNVRRARLSFAIEELPAAIDAVLTARGWTSW